MSPKDPNREWTIMVYLCGDNDLESSAVADLHEMKAVGSTDAVAVIAQFDRRRRGRPTRRYYLTKGKQLASDLIGPPLAETNGGDPEVLVDFARWAITRYPARRYLLIIWNHGMGWDDTDVYARARALGLAVRDRDFQVPARGLSAQRLEANRLPPGAKPAEQVSTGHLRRVAGRQRKALFRSTLDHAIRAEAIGMDDHERDFLDNRELRRALKRIRQVIGRSRGSRVDILGLDACLMSMVEVLYQLRGHTDCVIASEEVEPVEGWPWQQVLRHLKDQPSMSAPELSREIVRLYLQSYSPRSGVTLSALSLKSIEPLAQALDRLAVRLISSCRTPPGFLRFIRARNGAWRSTDTPDYVDLGGFCRELVRRSRSDRGLATAAAAVLQLLKPGAGIILASGYRDKIASPPTGLTVWLPLSTQNHEIISLYRTLDLAKHGAWGRMTLQLAMGKLGPR